MTNRFLTALGLASVKDIEALKKQLEIKHRWALETADAQQYDIPPNIIYANQADMYRLSPDLGTAIDKVGRDFGLSRLNVKRMVGEEERDIPNHPFEILWRTPNPLQSGVEFGQSLISSYILNGNAIIWMNKTNPNDNPVELWYLPYEMLEPVPDGRMFLKHYNYYPGMGKEPIPIPTWQIVHVKTFNPHSYFMGLSPMESLVDTITGNLGMRATKKKQYTDYGGAPQSAMLFPDWIPDDAWSDVNAKIRKAATENSILTLRGTGEGVTWLQRAMSSKDAEFVQNLESDMITIFNRVAPGLLQMMSNNSTEANALAARATYSETLWGFLEVFAQKLTNNPVDEYGRKLKVEFDDPRVVDRRLELDEQEQYSKTHTVDDVNEKYYQEPRRNDEFGKTPVYKIRSVSIGGNAPGDEGDEPTGADENAGTDQDDQADDVAAMMAVTELKKWRRMALLGKDKMMTFHNPAISQVLETSIKAKLEKVDRNDKSKIARIFDEAIKSVTPVADVTPEYILKGIEMGVKALELRQ